MIAYFLGNGVRTKGPGIGLLLKGGMTGTQGYGSKEQMETGRRAPAPPRWGRQSCPGHASGPAPGLFPGGRPSPLGSRTCEGRGYLPSSFLQKPWVPVTQVGVGLGGAGPLLQRKPPGWLTWAKKPPGGGDWHITLKVLGDFSGEASQGKGCVQGVSLP